MEIIAIDSDNHTVHCVSKVESFFMLRQVVYNNNQQDDGEVPANIHKFISFREMCVGVMD
jgi:hypothetical protein